MNLNVSTPLNNLSFGFVSYHILRELHRRGIEPNWFPIANADLSTFDQTPPQFAEYLQRCGNKAQSSYSRAFPRLILWHIAGSEASPSDKNYLFTFHELDQLTPLEVNVLNNQTKVFVSSHYTKQVFEAHGVTVPVVFIPLGFDSNHFRPTNKKYDKSRTVWSIFGKLERRKRHEKTIRAWLKKYGNDPKHMLHLHVYNSFLKPEDNQTLLNNIFEGKRYSNVNPLGYTKTLSEYNECLNVTDIVLDMSGAEGWSLPSFHCVGLGKHAVIHNVTAMKDWATSENAVLVEPETKISVVDGVFFHPNTSTNVGNIFDYNEDAFLTACDTALIRHKTSLINMAGLKLKDDFTWANTVDLILKEID